MSHIFISYSHQNSDYAHTLANSLVEQGFEVWIDKRINFGSQWEDEIEENLNSCAVFILIMTPISKSSKWVKNELSHAQRLEKPIFPLLLEGDTWLSVESTQYVDVRDGKLPPPSFFDTLSTHIPQQSAPTKQTTTRKQKATPQPKADLKNAIPENSPTPLPPPPKQKITPEQEAEIKNAIIEIAQTNVEKWSIPPGATIGKVLIRHHFSLITRGFTPYHTQVEMKIDFLPDDPSNAFWFKDWSRLHNSPTWKSYTKKVFINPQDPKALNSLIEVILKVNEMLEVPLETIKVTKHPGSLKTR